MTVSRIRYRNLLIMFIPLLIGFASVLAIMEDLKQVRVDRYSCHVLAVGKEAGPFKTPKNMLYSNHSSDIYDVAFQCQQLGNVLVNDYSGVKRSIAKGDKAEAVHKRYRYLPDSWTVWVQNSHD